MKLIYPQNLTSDTVGGKFSVSNTSIESSGHTPTKPTTYSPELSGDNERVDRLTCFCSKEASNSKHTCPCFSACSPSSMDPQKQKNKRVRFTTVKVYYFARTQGISTVPKSGEVSLGMVDKHFTERQFSLWLGHRPELKLTNESEVSSLDTTIDRYYINKEARIKMLKRSGVQVRKVKSLESIRKSRILCGCHCENGVCLSDTCQCALEGIVCQVDGVDEFGMTHPCWCNAMSCSNPCGRTEFDPEHVKNHYHMTMMRLKHAEKSVLCCFWSNMFQKGAPMYITERGEVENFSFWHSTRDTLGAMHLLRK
ncbi:unnamed protein product [Angiostrongylus costaricensis]|uniref:CSRNP_N domain-containing protein n=1 Tax=Angiostrongylus costaricensis TaxID=334426 RepID=A0A0R3PV94_ANGCS|nr:unnamed protein product [Angiostrongylus costaricensis]